VTIVALNALGGTPKNGVKIPNAPGQQVSGSPTSTMFNGSPTNFLLAPQSSSFSVRNEDGTIQGWNPAVNAKTAVIEFPDPQAQNKTSGAVYKGATIAGMNGKEYILAANFQSGRNRCVRFQLQTSKHSRKVIGRR